MQFNPQHRPVSASHGFTLLETVLAVGIAIGMMLVVLYFYQQTSTARSALLKETEKIAAIRRIMDKLTAELRGAVRDDYLQMGILGGPDYIQILTPQIPPLQQWNATQEEAQESFYPQSDLVEIGYVMSSVSEGTNSIPGLMRWQEPFLESVALLDEENLDDPVSILDTNSTVVATSTTEEESITFTDSESDSDLEEGSSPLDEAPVLPQIQHIRFRYYDGLSWWDYWEFTDLPLGVEISLGAEPMPEEEAEDMDLFLDEDTFLEEEDSFLWSDYTGEEEDIPEVFRRIVYLPGSMASFQALEVDPLLEDPLADDTSTEEPLP